MSIPWARRRPNGFSRPDSRAVVGRRCRYRSLGVSTRAVCDAAPNDLRTPVDHALPPALVPGCGRPSATRPQRRRSIRSGRVARTSGPILGHLDALYALAYLSSGDADAAQDVVIEAFKGLRTQPHADSPYRSRVWRTLADHVHLANQQRTPLRGSDQGPFGEARLSSDQREAIALLLVGGRVVTVAGLLAISPGEVRSLSHSGLTTLHVMWSSSVRVLAPPPPLGSQREIADTGRGDRGPEVEQPPRHHRQHGDGTRCAEPHQGRDQ